MIIYGINKTTKEIIYFDLQWVTDGAPGNGGYLNVLPLGEERKFLGINNDNRTKIDPADYDFIPEMFTSYEKVADFVSNNYRKIKFVHDKIRELENG
jgi:hypothetical protein